MPLSQQPRNTIRPLSFRFLVPVVETSSSAANSRRTGSAEYAVTGVRSFIVSQDGVVYEKDLGSKSLDAFQSMERFNPDNSWMPVTESGDASTN